MMNDEWKARTNVDLKKRTKIFALRVIKLYSSLAQKPLEQTIGKQVLRSATSVGANYREACRARSKAEFVSKVGIVLQELDETLYWFELLVEAEILTQRQLNDLMKEADELMAIMTSSVKKAKQSSSLAR